MIYTIKDVYYTDRLQAGLTGILGQQEICNDICIYI